MLRLDGREQTEREACCLNDTSKLLDVQVSSGRVAVVVAGVLPEFPSDGVQLVSGLVSSSVPPVSSPVST